jgi:hypothetical protein
VHSLGALEGVANPGGHCAEWVARVFLEQGQHPRDLADTATVCAGMRLQCRSHRATSVDQRDAAGTGCRFLHASATADQALRQWCAAMLEACIAALEPRLTALVAAAGPELAARLKFGADVTVRRTLAGERSHDCLSVRSVFSVRSVRWERPLDPDPYPADLIAPRVTRPNITGTCNEKHSSQPTVDPAVLTFVRVLRWSPHHAVAL